MTEFTETFKPKYCVSITCLDSDIKKYLYYNSQNDFYSLSDNKTDMFSNMHEATKFIEELENARLTYKTCPTNFSEKLPEDIFVLNLSFNVERT